MCAIGSSVETRISFVLSQMGYFIKSLGGRLESGDIYPGWVAKSESELEKKFVKAYKEQNINKEPTVWAAHAGLECGYFAEKFGDIDMISCGPTVTKVHTVEEILETDTVDKTAKLLIKVLEDLLNEQSHVK